MIYILRSNLIDFSPSGRRVDLLLCNLSETLLGAIRLIDNGFSIWKKATVKIFIGLALSYVIIVPFKWASDVPFTCMLLYLL